AERAGLGDKGGRAVDIADRQRARARNIGGQVGLGQVAHIGRDRKSTRLNASHRTNPYAGAGGQRNRERVGIGRAGGELVVRRARRVGPGAGVPYTALFGSAERAGLGDKGGRAVDIADRQRARARNIGGQVGLGQVAHIGREDRGLVGAGDVDGDRGQRAGGRGHRGRVGLGRAGGELVVRRARRGGPGAVAVDRGAAVRAERAGLGDKGGRAVDIADRQRARARNIGGQVGLGQVAHIGREDRGVVGAGDVDG